MAITIDASCAFLTPIGHQSNTLVMGPGGYKFGDYWRMGLLLELIVLAVAIPLILIFWPLRFVLRSRPTGRIPNGFADWPECVSIALKVRWAVSQHQGVACHADPGEGALGEMLRWSELSQVFSTAIILALYSVGNR
jgi:hypothetical protein